MHNGDTCTCVFPTRPVRPQPTPLPWPSHKHVPNSLVLVLVALLVAHGWIGSRGGYYGWRYIHAMWRKKICYAGVAIFASCRSTPISGLMDSLDGLAVHSPYLSFTSFGSRLSAGSDQQTSTRQASVPWRRRRSTPRCYQYCAKRQWGYSFTSCVRSRRQTSTTTSPPPSSAGAKRPSVMTSWSAG